MIRDAIPSDFSLVLPLFKKVLDQSIFHALEYDESAMQRSFATLSVFENGYARLVELQDQVVGCLVGYVGKNQFGVLVAQDVFNFSKGDTHLLNKDFIRWAKAKGSVFVQVTDYSRQDSYGELLACIGLKPASVNYIGVL